MAKSQIDYFLFLILLFNQTTNKFSLVYISCLDRMIVMRCMYNSTFTKVKNKKYIYISHSSFSYKFTRDTI